MARLRRYHPLVANDLATATQHYDKISTALGNRFRDSVRACLGTIAERPDSFGRIHEERRAAMVERFPYVVMFEHDGDAVMIVGVFHAASDREGWFHRAV